MDLIIFCKVIQNKVNKLTCYFSILRFKLRLKVSRHSPENIPASVAKKQSPYEPC